MALSIVRPGGRRPPATSRQARRTLITAVILLALLQAGLMAQNVRAREYQLKAVFLFNFAQFVEWPADAFPNPETPVVIGILGSAPLGDLLDQTTRGEQLQGRSFQVRRYASVDEIQTCHILFIDGADGARLDETLARLKTRSILTVGDHDSFVKRGGMVRFVTDRNRVRLQINPAAAQAARLTISSKLLRLAEIAPPQGR